MQFEISEAPIADVAKLAVVPSVFSVERIFTIGPRDATGAYSLGEQATAAPWRKDYDKIRGEGPREWPKRFDLTNWGFIQARAEGTRVGGIVIAYKSPDVMLLEGRSDLALVWDLRVAPPARRHGIGTALWRAAEAWAFARGCRELKVETQNINVPAGKFYAKMGCTLRGVDRLAYKILPDEIQLLWYKALSP